MKKQFLLLKILITLGVSTLLIMDLDPPQGLKTWSKSCPGELKAFSFTPGMRIRIMEEERGQHSHIRACLVNMMERTSNITLIDRSNEEVVVEELSHQHSIPTQIESLVPLGQLVAPNHLLVLEKRQNKLIIEFTDLKTGAYVKSRTIKINKIAIDIKQYISELYKILASLLVLYLCWFFIKLICWPIDRLINARHLLITSKKAFEGAITDIKSDRLYKASETLAKLSNEAPREISTKAKDMLLKMSESSYSKI